MRVPVPHVALLLLAGTVLPHAACPPRVEAAPVAQWDRIANPPQGRLGAGIAYDSRRDRVLVFGGYKRFGSINDLWSLDRTVSGEWTELATTVGAPPYEYCAYYAAVYDSVRDELLVVNPGRYYGGVGDTMAVYAYSFSGALGWRCLQTIGVGPPIPSDVFLTVLDPGEHRLIVVGEQTWALTLNGPETWTRLLPAGRGPSLSGVATALDAPHRRLLVNGGGNWGAPFLTATWALDLSGGTRWDSLAVDPIPRGRRDHVAIYDPLRDRLVVAGGATGLELLDAWALNLAAGSWSEVTAPVARVGKRSTASAVYDPQGDEMVIFGGSDGANYLVETVRLSLGSPDWEIEPRTAEPAHHASLVYDDQRQRMLLFGGLGSCENAVNRLYSLDMTTEPPRWGQIAVPGTVPVRRYSHMATWDPVRHRMFVFGGQVDATLLNDLWSYSDETSPMWTQVTTTGPPPSTRAAGALTYDPLRDRLVLLGGRSDSLDAWELPLGGAAQLHWRRLAPGGAIPTTRRSFDLVYDPLRDRFLIVGGVDAGGNSQPTFALELGSGGDGMWTTVTSRMMGLYSTVAMLRADSIVIYDRYSAISPLETYQLALAAPQAWTTVEVLGTPPRRRTDHCGAYDFHRDRLVIFGGQIMQYSNSERRWFGDTWLLTWLAYPGAGVDLEENVGEPFLGPPMPNPAYDEVTVAFSRRHPGPGALEIVDIQGRRVAERRLDDRLGSGRVVVRFDRPLPPGVYLIRLTGAPRIPTRKFCILH